MTPIRRRCSHTLLSTMFSERKSNYINNVKKVMHDGFLDHNQSVYRVHCQTICISFVSL